MGQWRIRATTSWKADVLMYRPWSVSHVRARGHWHMVINLAWLYWMGRMFMVNSAHGVCSAPTWWADSRDSC